MNSFVETLSPAARNHAEARIDYYRDLSQAVLHALRQLSDVNLQFTREWLDDTTAACRTALLTPPEQRDAGAVPQRAEAAAHRLQDYHRQLTQVASDFQAELNQIAQQHVPQTARTASELADAGRKAAGKHLAEEAGRFAAMAAQNQAMPQAASMQSADQGNKS